MLLCMRCRQLQSTLYFVSKEEAAGTEIQGPLVCRACFTTTFMLKPLPLPAYEYSPVSPEPVRLGSQLLVSEPDPMGRAFDVPLVQVARKLNLEEALQFLANGNPFNGVGFTWGPSKYNKAWAESIEKDDVIAYSLTIPKDCEQGLGVYLAANIFASCSYGNSEDTSLMMVVCSGTPMLDYSSRKLKDELALKVKELTGVEISGVDLTAYLSQKACRVRAVKKYGNYFALTTGHKVVVTFDGEKMKPYVQPNHINIVKTSSYPHAKSYIEKLFK